MNQLLWYYADLEKKRCLEDVEKRSPDNIDTVSKCPCGEKARMHFVRFLNFVGAVVDNRSIKSGQNQLRAMKLNLRGGYF